MKELNQLERPDMKYDVMDLRDMAYEDDKFDLIIDKSTIDALLCGDNSTINVTIMMKEYQRILKPGGTYVAISYGVPDNREKYFTTENLDFELKTYMINKHYLYMCKKLDGTKQKQNDSFIKVLKDKMSKLYLMKIWPTGLTDHKLVSQHIIKMLASNKKEDV
jgi:ubiquinone/menaquinone biosynthesis C-methylase UbiE